MAITADNLTQKTSDSVNTISQSISSTRSSLSNLSSSVNRISLIISNKTKVRTDLILKSRQIEDRRREAAKRRELEDQIEASKVSTNIRSGLNVASSTGKGPLGRILSFLGYMGAGWILENLPTWIAMGKEFIARMRKAGELIYSIPQTMWRILQNFGTLLSSVKQNILNLDFTDSSGEVRDSFKELTDTMDLLGSQIYSGFTALLKPSGEVEIPSTAEQQPDAEPSAPSQPSPSGGGGGGGRWKPLFDAIGAGEGNYTSMYPSENYPQLTSMTIKEVIQFQKQKLKDGRASAAVGKYQMLYPENYAKAAGLPLTAKFSPENQDKMAGAYIEKNRGGSDWLAGKITDEQFGYQLAKEFAGLKQPNGVGYYDKDGRNKATVDWKVTKSALQKVKSSSPQTPPKPTVTPQTPTAPPPPKPQSGNKNGYLTPADLMKVKPLSYPADYQDWYGNNAMLNPSAGKAFLSAQKEYGKDIPINSAYRSYEHQKRVSGSVKAPPGYSKHGLGLAIDLEPNTPYYNWMRQNGPKFGWYYSNIPGDPFHFEYKGQIQSSSTSAKSQSVATTTPLMGQRQPETSGTEQVQTEKPYEFSPQELEMQSAFNTELQSLIQGTFASQEQPQISPISTGQFGAVTGAITPQRKGQEILFIDDRSRASGGGGNGGSMTSAGKSTGRYAGGGNLQGSMLNRYMKQKLLLDLNYV